MERGRDLWTMQEIKSSLKRLARKHGDIGNKGKQEEQTEVQRRQGGTAELELSGWQNGKKVE